MNHVDIKVREFNRLREQLATEFGLDADDEAVIDTTSGEMDLEDLLVRMVRAARQRLAEAEVCAEQIKALSERKKRHADAAEKLRGLVAGAMIETGLTRLSPGDFTASASLTKPKAEVIVEEDLPPFYTKTVRKPDMESIKGEFQRCQVEAQPFDIPGVAISNGRPSLTVRV